MPSNPTDGVCYAQPKTLEHRLAVARDFVARHKYEIPLAVDRMSNEAEALYAAWPERLFVVDARGRIAFKGKPGPFGFDPGEVERWLADRR